MLEQIGVNGMKKIFITATVGLSLLTACSGSMNAVSSSGDVVQFKFTQGVASDTYTAVVGDESFKGRAVMVDAKTTFGTAFGSAYSDYGSVSSIISQNSFSSGGKVKATLIGDRGSSLKCLMQYADTSGVTSLGGIGDCVHSNGSEINVVW